MFGENHIYVNIFFETIKMSVFTTPKPFTSNLKSKDFRAKVSHFACECVEITPTELDT